HHRVLHSFPTRRSSDLAFHIASTGRPGPVVIDIPKDIANAEGIFDYSQDIYLPGYDPNMKPNQLQIRKLVEAFNHSKKPVILAGDRKSTRLNSSHVSIS